jgi:hypothetical protein
VVYVDSGSTDGSPARAAAAGAQVVALDMAQPFTAARARNAGLAALAADPPDLVLMIDGDCTLQPGFLPAAIAGLCRPPPRRGGLRAPARTPPRGIGLEPPVRPRMEHPPRPRPRLRRRRAVPLCAR